MAERATQNVRRVVAILCCHLTVFNDEDRVTSARFCLTSKTFKFHSRYCLACNVHLRLLAPLQPHGSHTRSYIAKLTCERRLLPAQVSGCDSTTCESSRPERYVRKWGSRSVVFQHQKRMKLPQRTPRFRL